MPRRTTFTSRALILAITVAALAVMLAVPLQVWLSQRAHIDNLRSQVSAKQRHVAQLNQQAARWQDPAYVRRQASRRLHYLLPGETLYTMLGPKAGSPSTSQPAAHQHPGKTADRPWYDQLWKSMMTAGGSSTSKR
jgi:cell division protein FtsB